MHRRQDQDSPPLVHLESALRVLGGDRPGRITWRQGDPVPMLGGRPLARFAALPSLQTPRVLLPLDSAAGLLASLKLHARSAASPAARLAARVLVLAARLGLAAPLMRQRLTIAALDDALHETPLHSVLADLLGRRDLSLALRLAPGRPNGKPVVQAVDPDGAVLAYAKFGWEPLTRRLIRHEGRMLTALAGPTRGTAVTIPNVLYAGQWQGLEALIVAPLPAGGRMPRSVTDIPATAIRFLAGLGRPTRSLLGDSWYWCRTKARIETLAPLLPAPNGEVLHDAKRHIERRWGDETLTLSLKHGDWIPPNMAVRADGGLSIWDWEHGDFRAPQGVDTMQFILFQALRRRGPHRALPQRLRHLAAADLNAQGVPAHHALFLACLSLMETILWYGEARQAGRPAQPDPQFATALRFILNDRG